MQEWSGAKNVYELKENFAAHLVFTVYFKPIKKG